MAKKRLDGLIQIATKKLEGGGVLRLLEDNKDNYQVEFGISKQRPALLLNNPKEYGDNREIEDIYHNIKNEEEFKKEKKKLALLIIPDEVSTFNPDDSMFGESLNLEDSGTYGALDGDY